MALRLFTPSSFCTVLGPPPRSRTLLGLSSNSYLPCRVRCVIATEISDHSNIVRRSANYQPSIWDYDLIQSLRSEYVGESYDRRSEKLKGDVRVILEKLVNPLDQLEMIDTLQRLGLAYHFQDEIKRMLKKIYNDNHREHTPTMIEDLYATALEFRLLRQHGYFVHQEVFNHLKDEQGNFKTCLCDDLKDMLYLYEASFLSMEGESMLEDARVFTTNNLEKYVKQKNDGYLSMLVRHALELPLHWRTPRWEAWWFIHAYENKEDRNPILLELAKLDFNMVQATHQEDLKWASRWWRSSGFVEKLEFARDGLMENFLWPLGMMFEPQFGQARRMVAKATVCVTTLDDVYDVYGTLDELEILTDAIERWDINATDQFPEYMKLCFLALYNTTNEMAFDILRDQGVHVLPYLKKMWADQCKAFMREARWYYSGYTPTLQEYLDNAWMSVGGVLLLGFAYYFLSKPIAKEACEYLKEFPNIVRWSSMIVRLGDDLGTSSDELKRGDVFKSIQLYMCETGASEEEAREHIRYLIRETWKKINGELFKKTLFPKTFIDAALNIVRITQHIYENGDGHAGQDLETHCRLTSLLIQPIPLTSRERVNAIVERCQA